MLHILGRVKPFFGHARVASAHKRRSQMRLRSFLEPLEARQLLATDVLSSRVGHAALAADLLDPHQNLHALKKAPKPLKAAITASVVAGPDARGFVTLSGKTYAKAKVKLDIGATGATQQTVKADAKGRFHFTFVVGFGATPVRLSAMAKGKKPAATIVAVSRPDTAPPAILVQGLSPGVLSRSEVTVTGNVSDVGTGVASLSALVDGGSATAVSFDPSGNFSFTTGTGKPDQNYFPSVPPGFSRSISMSMLNSGGGR